MYQKEKSIKLLNTDILVTAERFDHDVYINGVMRYNKGDLKDIQTVVLVSDYANTKGLNIGDKVKLKLSNYVKVVPKHKYDNAIQRTQAPEGREMEYYLMPPMVELEGTEYIHAEYSDVLYVVLEMDEVDDSGLILPDNKIIV